MQKSWSPSTAKVEVLVLYGSRRKLTANPPKDGSATVFKAEALRAQSKEFLIKKYSGLCTMNSASLR